MAGATLFGHIKHMVYTTGTSLIIALVAYAVMGFMHASSNEPDMSVMQEILDFIAASSNISLLTLIPPLFVIIAVAMKLPAIPSLVGGALLGVPLMFYNQAAIENAIGDKVINNVFSIMNNGISLGIVPEDASPVILKLSDLLSSSSVQGMMWTISIILAAMCFGGILDCTGMMASVAAVFLKVAKGRGGLVLSTELMCIITNAVCCDQYLSLVLPGRMFKESFEMSGRRGYDYIQLLLMEYLRRNHEKLFRCGFQLYSLRDSELAESDCIDILRLRGHYDDPAVGRGISKNPQRKRSRKAGGSQGAGSLALIEKVLPKVREINKDEGVGRARPAFSLCRKYRLRYFRNPGKSTFKAPAMHDRHVRENLRLVICFCLAKKAARFVKTMPKLSKKTSKAGKLC